MTIEQKDLLFKDLCARLPYDVKCKIEMWIGCDVCTIYNINSIGYVEIVEDSDTNGVSIERVKPYLFPLSSMTEEQKKEISKRYNYHNYYGLCIKISCHSEGYWDNDNSCDLQDYLWLIDWFNKNHFDYRGLIPMGLAIDATGLNIY